MNESILLVEDEPIIALAEKTKLEKFGYHVTIVSNGEEAIAQPLDNIDLILMDIDLGKGMSGVEAATIILRIKDIPLVFLSAHGEPEIVETTEKITSYGYILKSSGITVLLASIKMAPKLYEAREKLKAQEKGYREMFQSNPNPMWVYDLNTLKILTVNDAALKIYGYSKSEFENMCITDIRPKEDVSKLLENISNVTEGLDIAGKWRHVLKSGRIINVSIISHTIEWFGQKAEVVLSLLNEENLT